MMQPFRLDKNPSEDVLIAQWPGSIRKEDRPSYVGSRRTSHTWTEKDRRRQASGRLAAQQRKQAKYAAGCKPIQAGDADMLDLYAQGLSVSEISRQMGVGYAEARRRIVACHPTIKSLK